MSEYLRPWKLATLAIGMVLLIVGAWIEQLPDWDAGLSVVMALLTYIFSPWSIRIFINRRWALMPVAIMAAWLAIDGSYWLWNAHYGDEIVSALREANWLPSTCLYLICGLIWLYRGSLSELGASVRALGKDPRQFPDSPA